MYNIATLNKISEKGLDLLTDRYAITEDADCAEGILVRSQDMHSMPLSNSLLAIARAGAGVNNIPIADCTEKGIVVFNTPGANANAVKELVLAGIFIAARNITSAISWTSTLTTDVAKTVEKGKSNFAGTEIIGKTLGVVGLGAIGLAVANSAEALGMKIVGTDPYFSTANSDKLPKSMKELSSLEEVLSQADFVTLHLPVLDSTKEMFNKELLSKMKHGAILLNFSRDKLVNDTDLLELLESEHLTSYVTDFPNDTVLNKKGVISIPHLGASTEEAEENCAIMAVNQVMDYIENGNIINSVNFPVVNLGKRENNNRICIFTKGTDNPIELAKEVFKNISIDNIADGISGDSGYVLISTPNSISETPSHANIISVRIIQ